MLKDSSKNYVSSTIQFDEDLYKLMKVRAALLGITLKEFVNNALVKELSNEEYHNISDFNEETIKAIENVEKNWKKLPTYKNSKELFKHL